MHNTRLFADTEWDAFHTNNLNFYRNFYLKYVSAIIKMYFIIYNYELSVTIQNDCQWKQRLFIILYHDWIWEHQYMYALLTNQNLGFAHISQTSDSHYFPLLSVNEYGVRVDNNSNCKCNLNYRYERHFYLIGNNIIHVVHSAETYVCCEMINYGRL